MNERVGGVVKLIVLVVSGSIPPSSRYSLQNQVYRFEPVTYTRACEILTFSVSVLGSV